MANLKEKLKLYGSIFSASIGAVGSAQADIIYTDIDPDSVLSNSGDVFSLNMNGGVTSSIYLKLNLKATYNSVDVYGSQGVFYKTFVTGGFPDWFMMNNFSYGDYIGSTAQYTNDGFLGWQYLTTPYAYQGYFNNSSDAILGFRIWKSNKIHNGWLRLDVDTMYSKITIKDYAYNDIPNSKIKAGVLPIYADTCDNLLLEYQAKKGGASDLKISFSKATNEVGIEEYRVFLVNEMDTSLINLDLLRKTPYYQSFAPGSDITQTSLDSTLRDFRGQMVCANENYRFVVLSVPDDSLATNHTISEFSNTINTNMLAVDVATEVTAEDISDFCNSSDMEICFKKAGSELGIKEYRVMVVKEENASSFDSAKAASVVYPNYFNYPTGNNVCQILYPFSTDVDGDTIQLNKSYIIYVYSVADECTHYGKLSSASNTVSLSKCLSVKEELFSRTKTTFFNGQFSIQSDLPSLSVNIYSLTGELVYSKTDIHRNHVVNLSHLASSTYVAQIRSRDKFIFKKFIKP